MDDFDDLDAILKKKASKKVAKKKAETKAEEEQSMFSSEVVVGAPVVVSVTQKELSKEAKSEWSVRPKSDEEIALEAKKKAEAEAAAAAPASTAEPKAAQKFVSRGQSGATGKVGGGPAGSPVIDQSKFISLDDLGKEPVSKPESPVTAGAPQVGSPTSDGAPVSTGGKFVASTRASTGAYKPNYNSNGNSPTTSGAPKFAARKEQTAGSPTTSVPPPVPTTTASGATKWAPKPKDPNAVPAAAPAPTAEATPAAAPAAAPAPTEFIEATNAMEAPATVAPAGPAKWAPKARDAPTATQPTASSGPSGAYQAPRGAGTSMPQTNTAERPASSTAFKARSSGTGSLPPPASSSPAPSASTASSATTAAAAPASTGKFVARGK